MVNKSRFLRHRRAGTSGLSNMCVISFLTDIGVCACQFEIPEIKDQY